MHINMRKERMLIQVLTFQNSIKLYMRKICDGIGEN